MYGLTRIRGRKRDCSMYAHHERAIQRLIELLQDDSRFPALIISGSIAHKKETERSDVDVLLVASEEEYARRERINDFVYFNTEICDYPGGYIDGKVIAMPFLQEAAARGSEPTRYAYEGAFIAYSHIPDLQAVLEQITRYPEEEREGKMASFYSQVLLQSGYFIREADRRQDLYLKLHTASDLVLFGGRLLLAYNRILFPCHKSLMEAVEAAPEKPERYIELAETVMREPTPENAQAFQEAITNFHNWGISYMDALSYFFKDIEWNWRSGYPPLEDA